MTLVANAPTSTMATGRGQRPEARNAAAEQPIVERRRQPVDHVEDPDERGHADEQRHRDEEPGDEAAAQPVHARLQPPRRDRGEEAKPDDDAIPSEWRESRPSDDAQERTDDEQRRDEGHDEADGDLQRALPPRSCLTSSRSWAKAAAIVGMARKNENSAAAGRSSPASIPATIVAPDRETPGMSASACPMPIASARPTGVRSTSCTVGAGRNRSTISMTMPPMMNAAADDAEAVVEHRFHVLREEGAGNERGQKGHDTIISAKWRASRSDGRPATTETILAR